MLRDLPLDIADPYALGRALAQCPNPRMVAQSVVTRRLLTPAPPIPTRHVEEAHRLIAPVIVAVKSAPPAPAVPPKREREKSEMPAQIKTLADALKTAQESLPRAMAAAEKLVKNVGDLTDAVGQVETFSNEVQKHTAGVRALLGGLTNGGPTLAATSE